MAGRKKKVSAYNRFVAAKRKQGYSMAEAAEMWRSKRGKHVKAAAKKSRERRAGMTPKGRGSGDRRYTAAEWKKLQKAERSRKRSYKKREKFIEERVRKGDSLPKAEKAWKKELLRRERESRQSAAAYKGGRAMKIGSKEHKAYVRERAAAKKAAAMTSFNATRYGSASSAPAPASFGVGWLGSARDRARRRGKKRKLSDWNRYVAKHAGKGHTLKSLSRYYKSGKTPPMKKPAAKKRSSAKKRSYAKKRSGKR